MGDGKRRPVVESHTSEEALDHLKEEVADDLGLKEKIHRVGWGEMTTHEVGKIGGNMVRRMIAYAERHMDDNGEKQEKGSEQRKT